MSRTESGRRRSCTAWRVGSPPPQGSSLGSGLYCPAPSSLNRPHPPHSRAHRDFTAWRLIRDAFAVRERRGDPRVVPGFRCPFLPGMPSSLTPGSSIIVWSRTSMSTWPSPRSEQLGTPNHPAIRFTRGTSFGASLVHAFCYGLSGCSPSLYGSDRYARPSRAFTSRLPTDRSPSPLLDMTTTATGLLCWRDLHPLEWQLASLHQIPNPRRRFSRASASRASSASSSSAKTSTSSCPLVPVRPKNAFHTGRYANLPILHEPVTDGGNHTEHQGAGEYVNHHP